MSKWVLLLVFIGAVTSSDNLFGKEKLRTLVYFQAGANCGFPSGQTHFPVTISSGNNPLLPVVTGGFDRVPSMGYTTQIGVLIPLSNSSIHRLRAGIGLTRRDTRFIYFDYAVQWDGRTYTREMDEVRIANTEAELACSYLFTTGRVSLGMGLLGIAWRRQVYHDQFANGGESRAVSPSFVRFREWYPILQASYRIWRGGRVDVALYTGLSRRGFKNSETAWWDGQL